ncbi:MAG: hypothetical protein WD045_00280 [Pirellulaceae bacterium]
MADSNAKNSPEAAPLEPEEYVEQGYFFQSLQVGIEENRPMQDILRSVRDEVLVTTKLPLAIDFMAAELRHSGLLHTAMLRLSHYFARFQTYLVSSAEDDRGRFDFRVALEILKLEAKFRAEQAEPQAMFLFQFETICRHRLNYDHGLAAMQHDPVYDQDWQAFIGDVRRQIGLVELADMIYVRSRHYRSLRKPAPGVEPAAPLPPLFGDREGRIALANRRREPLLLFAALQRQLGYPKVPLVQKPDEQVALVPQLMRRMERVEARLKLMEEEEKGGIDLTKFYARPDAPPPLED